MTVPGETKPRRRSWLDAARLGRLTQKELRETLRDRRTVITLLLMPLLVYPILSLIFRTFLVTGAITVPSDKPLNFRFAIQVRGESEMFQSWFEGLVRDAQAVEDLRDPLVVGYLDQTAPSIGRFGQHDFAEPAARNDASFVRSVVSQGSADAGLIVTFAENLEQARSRGRTRTPPRIEVVANGSSALSQQAADYMRDYLDAINRNRMQRRGVLEAMSFLVDFDVVTSSQKAKPAVSFGTLIPFILVLMTITGAVYPAIDLTAGERERGTMEALVAAPIPRMRILFAKFIAVLTVAMLTATLNVLGMLATIWAFRLEGLIFESGKFSLISIGQVFALLLLFAAFFSALLLAVTSFARSFKEAQAYLIPLILLSLAPGVVSLAPGLTLSGPIALVPLLNFVLLARDILQGNVATAAALIAVLSTLLYAALAVAVASRIFGTDAILYGSQQSVRDSLRRPRQARDFISPLGALFCLTCLFPANFVAISLISRFADDELRLPLMIMAVVMIVFFLFFPLLFAWHQRVRLTSGFALGWPGLVPMLAAVLIGLTAWPITVILLALTQQVVILLGGVESGEAWQQRLVEGGQSFVVRWRQLPIALILLTHAVIPAVVEEWFFRGFLLQSLRSRSRKIWLPIVLSGIIFGAFHLLTESVIALDRFVPTTLMGIFLAVICVRTGSIWPGVLVHMLNNGTVISLAYYNQELQRQSWFPFQGDALPWMWLIGLLVVCAFAFLTLWRRPKRTGIMLTEG